MTRPSCFRLSIRRRTSLAPTEVGKARAVDERVLSARCGGTDFNRHPEGDVMQGSSRKRATAPIAVLLLLVLASVIPVAQAEPPPFIDCGQVITKSTVLVRDIGPCPEDGLIIGADNITLSLNGHRVFGTADTGAFAGVRLRRVNGVTVTGKNAEGRSPAGTAPMGSVDNFDAGVVIGGGSNNTVRDLDIHDNVGPEDFSADLGSGIAVFSSKDNLLSDNVVRRNGTFEGIGVFGKASTGNRIERNVIEDNHATITRTFDDGTSFEQTFTQGINLGLGLEGSHNNIIIGNEIRRSGLNGIVACSFFGVPCQTTGNVIRGNIIEDNAARSWLRFLRHDRRSEEERTAMSVLRVIVSVIVGLLPIVLAVAFLEVTSRPEDANIGGGLLLFISIPLGVGLGMLVFRSTRR